MELTLGQAAKAAGRGKSTIHRALKSGTLSGSKTNGGSWRIDAAELHRVFPLERPGTSQWDALEHPGTGNGTPAQEGPAVLAARVEMLTQALDRERVLGDELRDELRSVRGELSAAQERIVGLLVPPNRRWWSRIR